MERLRGAWRPGSVSFAKTWSVQSLNVAYPRLYFVGSLLHFNIRSRSLRTAYK